MLCVPIVLHRSDQGFQNFGVVYLVIQIEKSNTIKNTVFNVYNRAFIYFPTTINNR